ncbi:MAG: hypothetical protein ACKV19_08485 [Verrucomicrobiales bacterium]
MTHRLVEPEILDRLAWDDPEAVRARRDLRVINWIMGNERWIFRAVARQSQAAGRGIVEWGAGDGSLAAKLAGRWPGAPVSACDLAPRPVGLSSRVGWRQADVLEEAPVAEGGILVANLFLHHFDSDALGLLGASCLGFDTLVFCEPDRSRLALALSWLLWPWIGRVTRHDMPVSIRAGFSSGELPALLKLSNAGWQVEESSTCCGARRIIARRVA